MSVRILALLALFALSGFSARAQPSRWIGVAFAPPGTNAPVVLSLSPPSESADSGQFTLTVNGSGFITASVVLWNGAALPTFFVNTGQLSATVGATLTGSTGQATVTVSNYGTLSNGVLFQITAAATAPVITSAIPALVGITGKVQISGSNLGSSSTGVVVFSPNVVAQFYTAYSSTQIVARVPYGAVTGPVRVITGLNAAELVNLQVQIDTLEAVGDPSLASELSALESAKQGLISSGAAAAGPSLQITMAYDLDEPVENYLVTSGALQIPLNRIIVDLVDFLSFDVAVEIASPINAEIVGYLPATNSYILQLQSPPASLAALESIMAQLQTDSRVVDVYEDFALENTQTTQFADVDWVDRYRQTLDNAANENASLDGRRDAWPSDRIQGPGAWNLLDRFIPARDGQAAGRASLYPMRVAIYDSGLDRTHPEFTGVNVTTPQIQYAAFQFGGRQVMIPVGIAEVDYTAGDPLPGPDGGRLQHGTAISSLIGAANGVAIPGAANGDRGINGLLHNPMRYTLQVNRAGVSLYSDFLVAMSSASATGARVMNASWGNVCPIDAATGAKRLTMATALRNLSLTLSLLVNRLLLVTSSGNCATAPDPEHVHGRIVPYLGDGSATGGGNHFPCSVGLSPNALCVGAITSSDQRADFSDWGIPVQIAAPGRFVLAAGNQIDAGGASIAFMIGEGRYTRATGTSFAAPLVAGTAGLLLGIDPTQAPTALKSSLLATPLDITTTDGNGVIILALHTLKTGWAIRQALIASGAITNDTVWSGVSKIAYPLTVDNAQGQTTAELLTIAEIRRSAAGRSEAFAVRTLLQNGQPVGNAANATLTQNGRQTTWISDKPPASLLFQRFDAATGGSINFGAAGVTLSSQLALGYNPAGDLFFGINDTLSAMPNCLYQMLRQPAAGGAAQVLARTKQDCGSRFRWYSAILFPDNRTWGGEYTQTAAISGLVKQRAYTPILGLRPANSTSKRVAFTPDGAGLAYLDFSVTPKALVTRAGTAAPHSEEVAPAIGSLAWSPDGSELAYSGVGNAATIGDISLAGSIQGIRRDARSVTDRLPMNILTFNGVLGSNEIYFLSWQW